MFEYFIGTLVKKTTSTAVLEIQGIGYLFEISLGTYETLPAIGKEYRLWAYHYVRDDAQRLYGFATTDERELFLELLSVSGIGPKVALGILSGGTVSEVQQRIVSEDIAALKKLPGIGPKTAKRIILELRESLAKSEDEPVGDDGPAAGLHREGVMALEALGYSKSQSERAVSKLLQKNSSFEKVEDLLKAALQYM